MAPLRPPRFRFSYRPLPLQLQTCRLKCYTNLPNLPLILERYVQWWMIKEKKREKRKSQIRFSVRPFWKRSCSVTLERYPDLVLCQDPNYSGARTSKVYVPGARCDDRRNNRRRGLDPDQ